MCIMSLKIAEKSFCCMSNVEYSLWEVLSFHAIVE
jgi:hypothetical protein